MLIRALLKIALASTLAAILTAHAQEFPVKPIRFVASAVGGPVDGVGRFLANGLTERFKQQVISDGRSGANGIIGTDIVAKANADGYTLLMTTGSFVINPSIYKKLPYDTLHDFLPVSLAATSGGLVLVAHPSVAPKSVKELIEYDHARPGQITYGSGGIGNTLHMAGELFNIMAHTRLTHVPYKGSAPALTDVLGGHIALMFPSTVIATPHVKSGRLRALGFTGLTRSKVLPEVPTIDESGLKGFDVTGWYGLFAPAGTPRRIVNILQSNVAAVVNLPQARDQLDAWGLSPVGSTPGAFLEFIHREMDKYARIAREANIPKQ
jgi:tripartite-type tricarboxylate transporter receptor subunit TctC